METVEPLEIASPRKPFFNKQNARENQLKAVQSRMHNQIAEKVAESLKKLGLANEPRIALVERELARAAKMMSDTEDVDAYQKLSAARARLFSEWQVLSGTPNPGSSKGKRGPKASICQPEPISPTSPEPAIKCNHCGYSGPETG